MSEARPLSRFGKTIIVVFVVLVAIVAIGIVRLAFYGDQQKNEKQSAQQQVGAEQAEKKDLATQVAEACAKGGEAAKALTAQGACGKAKKIIQEPVKVTDPGLDETQVRNVVREEVARRNLNLTPAQVNTVAAAAVKLVPKPKDGKTPTTAELQPLASAAVATFCANGACRGKDGADAPAVTSDQLTATLVAYCADKNGCVGDDGKDGQNGANGRSVVVSIEAVAGGNKVTFTYTGENPPDPVSFVVADGKDGEDGEAGPPCPEGSTLQKQHVVTTESPTGIWIVACVLDDQNP